MSGPRADPDALLRVAAVDAEEQPRGRLKVFLGMAAGVGKTYAMLSEAKARRAEGLDIVVAYAETHGRRDTEAMAEGLEAVPVRRVAHRGTELIEPDWDAVRERRPSVALVDELAHSNAPGSKRLKRWQDVLDLLDDGVSVWTALNVQHIESVADVVEDMTYAPVRERVPDSVLDRADEIRLVDLAPGELIERLSEGKVYRGERSREALERFFKPRNLAALRELALRWSAQDAAGRTAAFAGADAARFARSGAKLAVAVGPSPSSEYLIRWTRRAAFSQRAEWMAVHADTGGYASAEDAARVEKHMELARRLGAETITVAAVDVVRDVLDCARARGTTQIVVGKSGISFSRLPWRRPSIAERFMRESSGIDCVAVQERDRVPRRSRLAGLRGAMAAFLAAPIGRYGAAAAAWAALTAANVVVARAAGYRAAAIVYLAGVTVSSISLPLGPVLALAAASALSWNFFFIPPLFTFAIGRADDALTFALYFVVAIVTGALGTRTKTNAVALAEREKRMRVLYDLAQKLAAARGSEECVAAALEAADSILGGKTAFVPRGSDGDERASGSGAPELDEKETAAARYACGSGVPCGRGTDILPEGRFRWLPVAAGSDALGAVGMILPEGTPWTAPAKDAAAAIAHAFASALERERLADRRRRASVEAESERLAKTLLDSVSHEMRTPLAAIAGAASALGDAGTASDPAVRGALVEELIAASGRLDALVGNLLSMTRIESGFLRIAARPSDPAEILAAAAADAREASRAGKDGERRMLVDASAAPRPALLDEALIVQAVSNVARNAIRYSPADKPIELRAVETGSDLVLSVRDYGQGLRPDELASVFGKFCRGKNAKGGGLGLGLSICKGIVEAHGGSVEARLPPGGGLEVAIALPGRATEDADAPRARG